ncbi:hypothetical protein TIFTF001_000759 [Ficus carica]|uniref:Uncharacterized protein n=1 Tax=Ficus carica TaxID=3494 RepID=A0AA87ZID7_FICCA|nr:hypothetical protein TIFTF001_000759 [Ficus carica]
MNSLGRADKAKSLPATAAAVDLPRRSSTLLSLTKDQKPPLLPKIFSPEFDAVKVVEGPKAAAAEDLPSFDAVKYVIF